MPAIKRFGFRSFDEADASMRQRFPTIRAAGPLGHKPYHHTVEHLDLGQASLSRAQHTGYWAERGATDDWSLAFVISGGIAFESRQEQASIKSGRGMLIPPSQGRSITSEGYSGVWGRFSSDIIEASLGQLAEARIRDAATIDHAIVSPVLMHRLEQLATMSFAAFERTSVPVAALARLTKLYEELLTLEVANALLGPGGPPMTALDSRKLKRAEEYMAAHLAEAIGPDQISRAAGMSIRAMQYAFRKAHGTTPGAFLKAMRLDRVRARLFVADEKIRVVDVAYECGFNHLGEFGAAYLARFGERPSETIKRRK